MLRPCRMRQLAIAALPMFVLVFAGERPTHAQQSDDWTVSEVRGEVLVIHGNDRAAPMSQGDQLAIGSTIETPRDGQVVLTRGGTLMTVSPNSVVSLASESAGGDRTTIFQKIGSVLYKVEKRSEQHFEVETPYLAAVVKGTSFSVGVNRDTAITHVVEGAVEVTSLATRQVQIVRPGQTATVSSANGMQLQMSHNRGGATEPEAAVQASAATPEAKETQSNKRVLNRTLGVTVVDIGKVTDGLATSAKARAAKSAAADTSPATALGAESSTSVVVRDAGITDTSKALSVGTASIATVGSVGAVGDVSSSFPGLGVGVTGGFPGQGGGVAGGFPGQGVGVVNGVASSLNNNPNSGPCNNSGNGTGNGNGKGNGNGNNC